MTDSKGPTKMLKLCDVSSPEGQKLARLAMDSMGEAMPLLVNGVVGRPLEALVLLVRGALVPGDRYASVGVELIDLEQTSAWDAAIAGPMSAEPIPPGHITVCAQAEGNVLLALKPLPPELASLRRLAELASPSSGDSGDAPGASNTPDGAGRSPLLDRLLLESPARVDDVLRAAVRVGVDLSTVAVFVTPGGDGVRHAPPRVELADRGTLFEALIVGKLRPEQIRPVGAGSVQVVYMAPDGLGIGQAKIPQEAAGRVAPDGKTARNRRCPCGSSRKYKHCCVNRA